jgi:hypothetical protein
MERPAARAGVDVTLGVRVRLPDCEPEIWRLLELHSSSSLGQVHDILESVFGWEEPTCTGLLPAALSGVCARLTEKYRSTCSGLLQKLCEERIDLADEECSVEQLLAAGARGAFYE